MAITLNDINFARVSKLGTGQSVAMVRKSGMSESNMNSLISQTSDSATIADALGVVNALEIDWNGAELGNTYDGISRINTTGELIKVLQMQFHSLV